LRKDIGQLKVGAQADVCILDAEAHWQVTADSLRSQGKFTPFSGYDLPGRVKYTLVGGQVAYQA
jgi:dihydroorotase